MTVLFYVDDIIVIYHDRDNARADLFEEMLMGPYETKSLGQINHFLGIRVVRREFLRKIWLVQDSYMYTMIKKLNIDIQNQKFPSTPLPTIVLYKNKEQATAREIKRYHKILGKFNCPAVITRPDIAHGASKLSEFLQSPSKEHLESAEHMVRYSIGTKYRGIEFDDNLKNESGRVFVASSDASFADDPETRHSSNGFCFQIFNGIIHWKATKQKTVITSSTEAELLALTLTAKEYLWWLRLYKYLNPDVKASVILCDNQQTLRLLQKETPKLATRLKYVDIHQCWLRKEFQSGSIEVNLIETNKMILDGFTKTLPVQKHKIFFKQMNLMDVNVTKAELTKKIYSLRCLLQNWWGVLTIIIMCQAMCCKLRFATIRVGHTMTPAICVQGSKKSKFS